MVDRTQMGEMTVTLDCDVLNADGGTRCAAITGAWVALSLAFRHMLRMNVIKPLPLTGQVAAVSCGIIGGGAGARPGLCRGFVGRSGRQLCPDRQRRYRRDASYSRAGAFTEAQFSGCCALLAKASRCCSRRSARRSRRG